MLYSCLREGYSVKRNAKTLATLLGIVIGYALLLVTVPAALADDPNPLRDPGFEQRLSPELGGWRLFDESMYSGDQARTGSQSMFNWGFSRNVPYPPYLLGSVSGSFQEFAATPGSQWRLIGYGVAPVALEGAPAFGVVQISFFDADGEDLGTVETASEQGTPARISNKVSAATPVGQWTRLDTGIVTAPAGTAVIHAFTLFVDYSGSNRSQGVYFDDLTLCRIDGEALECQELSFEYRRGVAPDSLQATNVEGGIPGGS